jgi:glutamate synthase (NADPH/NADH) small chain
MGNENVMIYYQDLVKAFQELETGYSPQEAVAEAARCVGCEDAPCAKACPAGVEVAKFIRQVASRNLSGAIRLIKEENILAGTCARICPQSSLCEGKCSSKELASPIKIGRLQRFAADQELEKGPKPLKSLPPKGIKVAVVGAGPAGLSAATFLKRLGYDVDLYEAESLPGGVLTYSIPPYRLPKQVVQQEVNYIRSLGVRIHTRHPVDDPVALLDLYRAVFIGTGANRPSRLGIHGEDLPGVIQAVDFLREVNLALIEKRDFERSLGDRVVVIGGGNAAIDGAVTARRLGIPEVTILYRRTEEEMPAWDGERAVAQHEGVRFWTLASPIRFLGNGKLSSVECLEVQLSGEDETGRMRPVPLTGTEFRISCDTAVLAIGQEPGKGFPGLKQDPKGLIEVDGETQASSVPGVYAGGDAVRGINTAVRAVGDGKRAAFAADAWIQGPK